MELANACWYFCIKNNVESLPGEGDFMRYIWKNLKSFFESDAYFMFLLIFTVMISGIMIHYAYALYINFQEENKAGNHVLTDIQFDFDYSYEREDAEGSYKLPRPEGELATVGMLKDFAAAMSYELQSEIQDAHVDIEVDSIPIECCFSIRNNDIVRDDENLPLANSGRYFTAEEYRNGEKVAYAYDLNTWNVGCSPRMESLILDHDTMLLQGKKYKVVGYGSTLVDSPMVPITALDDDTPLAEFFSISFKNPINRPKYEELLQLCQGCFQNHVRVSNLNLAVMEDNHLNNTILILAACIILVAVMNFTILYRYILEKRSYVFRIYRICGMQKWAAVRNYLLECALLVLPAYGISVALFRVFILPEMSEHFYYLEDDKFGAIIYAVLFLLYFGISLSILSVMIYRQLSYADAVGKIRNRKEKEGGGI